MNRQEDLQMFGNELNYVTTLWTVGYIIGQVPSNIALTKIRPSIWLPWTWMNGYPSPFFRISYVLLIVMVVGHEPTASL